MIELVADEEIIKKLREKLPYRLIQLYTFQQENILDPFMGSCQTAIAAIKAGRHYIGYEIEERYVKLAEQRIRQFTGQQLEKSLQGRLLP